MDGTLVDTEPYWTEAEFALAERYGGSWSREHALQLVGSDLLDSGALHPRQDGHRRRARADRRGAAGLGHRAGRAAGAVAAGARELLASCAPPASPARWSRCPTRVSSSRSWPGCRRHLRARWSPARGVDHGKPHPEPYLRGPAARRPGRECLAIEDSDTGATSAVAAGCRVLVAPLHVSVPHGPGRIFTESLVGLSAASTLPG